MPEEEYDVIIVGSGAGGAAAAYRLVRAGQRVLMLERGDFLPLDGSTLDVQAVFKEGRFKSGEGWQDQHENSFSPDEYHNVGGKTKWYGAALLRFSAHEFQADEAFQCRGWPLDYEHFAPFYDEAERLLELNRFDNEPELRDLTKKICEADEGWRSEPLPLGLKTSILDDPLEAKHFDGFASVSNYKSDAETNFLDKIKDEGNFTLLTNRQVVDLLSAKDNPRQITGVKCLQGNSYFASKLILAAGAMSSPRILQDYIKRSRLAHELACAKHIGGHFKMHVNTALLGFSLFKKHDLLRKTAIFFNENFPHSSVQCLGWLDGEMLAAQLPSYVPEFVTDLAGERAFGFFVTTEDGSHKDNRIISRGPNKPPVMDYDLARLKHSTLEHDGVVDAFSHTLLHGRNISVDRAMGMAGTAHALGSMICGSSSKDSVVDKNGKVHDMDNLYVADGSVLPRSSRVNPALTIYAWGLRLGQYLARRMS